VNSDVSFFSKNEIIHQTSYSHTSQQNGIAECKHRHILNVARTMMIHMHVLKYLWYDDVLSACHLINMMRSSILKGQVPYCRLYLNKTLLHITPHAFGCTYFVQNLSPALDKLSP